MDFSAVETTLQKGELRCPRQSETFQHRSSRDQVNASTSMDVKLLRDPSGPVAFNAANDVPATMPDEVHNGKKHFRLCQVLHHQEE